MSHRRSTFATALLAGPLALALVACGGDSDTEDDNDTDISSGLGTSTTQTPAAPSGDAATRGDLLAAARTALAAVDGSALFSIDDETSGWEVTVVSADGVENDVTVSLDGSAVTRGPVVDTDDADDRDDEAQDVAERQQLLSDARVDHVAAIEAAQGAVPDGTVTGADLDLERGTATWEVQLDEDTAAEQTVTVDAVTGEVLRTERDD
ncbi:PepSY domain-containing protein [Nocardioides psychrotolerans]|uniref:PepSY domain-containing protein n=1 Tax=Nocardioides psychrotolerans TaxID=1005945 RepID=UPI0031378B2F